MAIHCCYVVTILVDEEIMGVVSGERVNVLGGVFDCVRPNTFAVARRLVYADN